jgi:hypothetical protein
MRKSFAGSTRLALGVGALALGLLASTSLVSASGAGAKYGAHDPRTCASFKEPANGAMSAGIARRYFICGAENETHMAGTTTLNLVSDVKVEIGASRPFNMATDSFTDVDPRKPVFPIRGSFWSYYCGPLGAINGAPGKNCASANETIARGECYNDTFGDWHCVMLGNVPGSGYKNYQAPPTRL